MQTNFTIGQIVNLFTSLVLLLLLLYTFNKHRNKNVWLYVLLFAFSLSLNVFTITLDSFLNTWDERYHILVAKNALASPWFPRLYNEKVVKIPYDPFDWGESYVWLHKQPFFTWLMSLSHGIFGDSEWCYRVPDAVLVAIVTLVYFRLGNLLFDKETGLIAALLSATSYYLHSMMSGLEGMDHNDVIFYALVTFSIWAFIEWTNKPELRFAILIGVFPGVAVLTKWLTGLWVFEGFFFYLLLNKSLKKYGVQLLLSLFTCMLVFLPWQIYAYVRWPQDYMNVMDFNSLHLTNVVEGHEGDWLFYFSNWPKLYGSAISLLIIPALFFGFKNLKRRLLTLTIAIMIVTIYIFFIIFQTKVAAFVFPASVFIYLSLGYLVSETMRRIFSWGFVYFFSGAIVLLLILNFRLHRVELEHTLAVQNRNVQILTSNKLLFQKMKKELPPNSVLFNIKNYPIDAMFYTGFISYYFLPDISQLKEAIVKKKVPVIFEDTDYQVPDSLKQIKGLLIYRGQLEHF